MNVGTFTVLDDAGRAYSLPNVPKERQWGENTPHSVSLRPVTADAKTETELSQKSLNIPNLRDDGGNSVQAFFLVSARGVLATRLANSCFHSRNLFINLWPTVSF